MILDVVEEVLVEKGYHDMSIDEIAARAGVAKGTLYQHFPSKSDLIFALFERNMAALEQVLARVTAADLTARGKLEAILRWVYREQPGDRAHLLQFFYSNEDIRRILFEKKAQLRERSEQFTTQLNAIMEQGQAAGEFDPAISASLMVTNFVFWLAPGRYRYAQIGLGERLSPDELMAQVEHIFFDGIAVKSARNVEHE